MTRLALALFLAFGSQTASAECFWLPCDQPPRPNYIGEILDHVVDPCILMVGREDRSLDDIADSELLVLMKQAMGYETFIDEFISRVLDVVWNAERLGDGDPDASLRHIVYDHFREKCISGDTFAFTR